MPQVSLSEQDWLQNGYAGVWVECLAVLLLSLQIESEDHVAGSPLVWPMKRMTQSYRR